MQDLSVIGVENGALIVSSNDGTRFSLAIDDVLQAQLRTAPAPGAARKLAPREIQALIRSGMSAEEVAASTGVPVEYIRKYEGPVLAEREFVIESALNVGVHTAIDTDPLAQGSTFGTVIRDRLHDLGATGERWASWKEADGGWVVKLFFTADQIEHDARWHYEPKKAALAPMNSEANTLSQQGDMPGGLIPRLRAVSGDERPLDSSRFDSGAFDVRGPDGRGPDGRRSDGRGSDGRGSDGRGSEGRGSRQDSADYARDSFALEAAPFGRPSASSAEVSAAAINRAPTDNGGSSQTADLLDALRRRRGERESAAFVEEESRATHPSSFSGTGNIRLVDVPLDVFDDGQSTTAPQPHASAAPRSESHQPDARSQAGSGRSASAKRGRAAMPSWDEIVFGARSDDDLA